MGLSRRMFFRGGVGVVAGVALGTGTACGPGALERPPGDLSDLDLGTFASEVGSTCQVLSGPAPFTELTLVAVDDLALGQAAPGSGEVFAVHFQGPKTARLPQDLYRLEHPRLGAMSILIVPLGARADGFLYEAIFNRQTA